MPVALYYGQINNSIIPYSITSRGPPEIMRYKDNQIKGIGTTLSSYLRKLDNSSFTGFPRFVSVDDSIDLDNKIIKEFIKSGMKFIKMEPPL